MTAKKRAPVVTSAELDATPPGSKPDAQLSTQRIYTGKIVKLDRDTVRFPDGSDGELEIVRHPGAARSFRSSPTRTGTIRRSLLKQYRYAAGGTSTRSRPAGSIRARHRSRCAARELKEETGCTAEVDRAV